MNSDRDERTIRILYLEDDHNDIELVKNYLSEKGILFKIRTAEKEQEFLDLLENFNPDIILADYNLPEFNGLSALRLTRRDYPHIPFIFITGAMGDEMAVKVLKLGATDFILKKNTARLIPAISRALKESEALRDREKYYRELVESEARYRALVEDLPVGIFRTSVEHPGRFLQVNRTAVEMFGYKTSDELYLIRVADLYVDPEERKEIIRGIADRGSIKNRIARFRKKNGEIMFASISAHVHRDEADNIDWIEGILEDVTDKKEAEDKLCGYASFLETLIDTSSNPVYYKDAEGRYLGCNNAFADIIAGLPRDKIIGKTVHELGNGFPEKMVQIYDSKDRMLLQNPGQQVYDLEVRCADGIVRDFHFSKATYNGADGNVAGIVCIMFDISDRVSIENDLRRINEEFDLLITSMPSIIISVSVKDRVRQLNPYTEKLFGIKSEDVINKRFYECGIKWDWESVYEAIGTCMFEEVVVRLDDLRFTRPDGKEGILGLTLNPLIRSGTIIEGFIILGKDLTEQKILEGQLLQSRKLEAIGQLSAGVAHEINTPLQYVGDNLKFIGRSCESMSEVLKLYQGLSDKTGAYEDYKNSLPEIEQFKAKVKLKFLLEELPKAISQSQEGVERVSAIVQSMKAFSHPGLGSKQPADINRSIENTVNVSRNEWKYDAEVILDLDETLPEIPCLESEFNQVILNLIINAVDAIHEARQKGKTDNGIIKISTRQDIHCIIITVEDNGTGIPRDIMDRIFDPFFTTKDVGKGTGQGLAISYNVIVEKHGGSMYVDSEYGINTIFTIKIPKKDRWE